MKRALISVFDKTGVVDFARALVDMGFEIVSTGGTRDVLARAGVRTVNVEDVTGYPECLGGRVKTLHPAIHAGLLAMRDEASHMRTLAEIGVKPIDIVAVNLYPFRQTIMRDDVTLAEAIENIDIGGPSMLRSAAKNYRDVCAIVDPADYELVVSELRAGGISMETKKEMCCKAFEHTAAYDSLVSSYLRENMTGVEYPLTMAVAFEKVQDMRYGENPHQSAAFYKDLLPVPGSLALAEQLNGKELSYNNISDANGALELLGEFEDPTVVAVKHGTPCGVGSADTVYEAWSKAYEADMMSIFGGIIVANRPIDLPTASELNGIFIEIVIAPDFEDEALKLLKKKKNLRILKLPSINIRRTSGRDMKKVVGGMLVQQANLSLFDESDIKVVTKAQPSEEQWSDMRFAMKVVKHAKSNGIAVAKDLQSLGIGPGQVNRIWATEQALERSGEKVLGAVLASDGFFPFQDCVQAAAKAGIACIIVPGGSMNDAASIEAADAAGIAMAFTGMRHFKH